MIESPTPQEGPPADLANIAFYRGYKLVDTLGGTTIATRANTFAPWRIIDTAMTRDQAKRVVDGWVEREVR